MLNGFFAAFAAATTAFAVQPEGARPLSAADRTSSQQPGASRDAGLRVMMSADGGPTYLGDPPGEMSTPDEATDAGSPASADAGPAYPGVRADELQRLRSEVAAFEQQVAKARADSQSQLLQQLNDQIAALREQLAQEQAGNEAQRVVAQQARERTQDAVTALFAAQRHLAFGDSEVLDTLDSTSPALPFPAQDAVQHARVAVQSGDLAVARYWLSVAIADAQRTQLRY
jgi:hypothetical protein